MKAFYFQMENFSFWVEVYSALMEDFSVRLMNPYQKMKLFYS